MEGRRRRSFTDEYKRQAVDLVASSGRSIGSVAKELGLRDSVLRRWVEHRGAGREPTAGPRLPTTQAALPSADQAAEIARFVRVARVISTSAADCTFSSCASTWPFLTLSPSFTNRRTIRPMALAPTLTRVLGLIWPDAVTWEAISCLTTLPVWTATTFFWLWLTVKP